MKLLIYLKQKNMDKSLKNIFANFRKGTFAILCIVCLFFYAAFSCISSTMSDIEGSDESSNIVDIENFISASCEDKVILKILNNEPAIVRKTCFEHVERVDTFFFELVNRHSEFFSNAGVFPTGEIPNQFRKEGLSVYISGNVTSCTVLGGCSEPNIKLASIPLLELKSIKLNK